MHCQIKGEQQFELCREDGGPGAEIVNKEAVTRLEQDDGCGDVLARQGSSIARDAA